MYTPNTKPVQKTTLKEVLRFIGVLLFAGIIIGAISDNIKDRAVREYLDDNYEDIYNAAYQDGYDAGSEEAYNNGYQDGYDEGYYEKEDLTESWYSDGYDDGFQDGYSNGQAEGYEEGYYLGYSGSVVDFADDSIELEFLTKLLSTPSDDEDAFYHELYEWVVDWRYKHFGR